MISPVVLLYINLNIVSPTWNLHLSAQNKAVDKAESIIAVINQYI